MNCVLIVDDSKSMRQELVSMLSDTGYEIFEASDGVEALEVIKQNSEKISAILLDWVMPKMDGISFMKEFGRMEVFQYIPVVMLTSRDDEEDVRTAIEAGVFYFLKKPVQKNILLPIIEMAIREGDIRRHITKIGETDTTVSSVIGRYKHRTESLDGRLRESEELNIRLQQEIEDILSEREGGLPDGVGNINLTRGRLYFKTIDEGLRVASWLGKKAENAMKVAMGLGELFTNSVEHGNLELDYDDKTRLLGEREFDAEVLRRYNSEKYSKRRVRVDFEVEEDEIVITIEDCGKGFDYKSYFELTPDRAFDLHGRGIVMSKRLYLNHLEYFDGGKVAVVREKPANSEN